MNIEPYPFGIYQPIQFSGRPIDVFLLKEISSYLCLKDRIAFAYAFRSMTLLEDTRKKIFCNRYGFMADERNVPCYMAVKRMKYLSSFLKVDGYLDVECDRLVWTNFIYDSSEAVKKIDEIYVKANALIKTLPSHFPIPKNVHEYKQVKNRHLFCERVQKHIKELFSNTLKACIDKNKCGVGLIFLDFLAKRFRGERFVGYSICLNPRQSFPPLVLYHVETLKIEYLYKGNDISEFIITKYLEGIGRFKILQKPNEIFVFWDNNFPFIQLHFIAIKLLGEIFYKLPQPQMRIIRIRKRYIPLLYAAGLLPVDKKMEVDLTNAYLAGHQFANCNLNRIIRNLIIVKSKLNDPLNEARQDFRRKPKLGDRRTFLPDEVFY